MKELANVFLGALGDTRGRGSIITVQRLGIRTKEEYGNQKMKEGAYPKQRRIAGGASEAPLSKRLMPAIATGKPRVFGTTGRRKEEGAVANRGLLPMQGQRAIFMAQSG